MQGCFIVFELKIALGRFFASTLVDALNDDLNDER